MRPSIVRQIRSTCGILGLAIAITTIGCLRDTSPHVQEVAFVKGAGVPLRDQLGPTSGVVSTLTGGERVEVLSKRSRWSEIRTTSGRRGWLHSRDLASEKLYGQFQQLANQSTGLPSQGKALIRREVNLHLDPSNSSETLYRLAEGDPVEILTHRTVERQERATSPVKSQDSDGEDGEQKTADAPNVEVRVNEDWFLVRGAGAKTGWVRESFFDMAPPIEVSRYSEGLRVRAWFVLFEEHADGEVHPWYLWATVHPKQGLPFDFDEIRVFVWNPAKSRYETSYRERNLFGVYPIQVHAAGTQGGTPGFELQLEDAEGKRIRKTYVMAGRLVRSAS